MTAAAWPSYATANLVEVSPTFESAIFQHQLLLYQFFLFGCNRVKESWPCWHDRLADPHTGRAGSVQPFEFPWNNTVGKPMCRNARLASRLHPKLCVRQHSSSPPGPSNPLLHMILASLFKSLPPAPGIACCNQTETHDTRGPGGVQGPGAAQEAGPGEGPGAAGGAGPRGTGRVCAAPPLPPRCGARSGPWVWGAARGTGPGVGCGARDGPGRVSRVCRARERREGAGPGCGTRGVA